MHLPLSTSIAKLWLSGEELDVFNHVSEYQLMNIFEA